MAPEQSRGAPALSHKTDLYALGIVLYQMLVGKPAFEGNSPVVLMHCHLNEPPPRPSSKMTEIPKALDELILSLMAKSPAERPWDAAAAGVILRGLQDKVARAHRSPWSGRQLNQPGAIHRDPARRDTRKRAGAKSKKSKAATPPPAVKKGEKDIFDDTDFEVDVRSIDTDSDDKTVQLEAASDFDLEDSDTGSEVFAVEEEAVDQNASTAMAPSAFAEDDEDDEDDDDDGFDSAVSSEMAFTGDVDTGTTPVLSPPRPDDLRRQPRRPSLLRRLWSLMRDLWPEATHVGRLNPIRTLTPPKALRSVATRTSRSRPGCVWVSGVIYECSSFRPKSRCSAARFGNSPGRTRTTRL